MPVPTTLIDPPSPAATVDPPRPGAPVRARLAAAVVALAVGVVTLGPSGPVAECRRAAVTAAQTVLGPLVGTVGRGPVEDVANVALFLPVGLLVAVLLPRRAAAVHLLLGSSISVLVELAQSVLPGRVPDLADIATNTVGVALGILLAAAIRGRHTRRPSVDPCAY